MSIRRYPEIWWNVELISLNSVLKHRAKQVVLKLLSYSSNHI